MMPIRGKNMRHFHVPALLQIAVMLAGLSGLAIVVAAELTGDAGRGMELASDCAACHGADGNSPSSAFPIIAGQHEAYLYAALLAYQSRSRDNAIMSATIVGKTDQQLRDLAAWFASQKGLGGGAGESSGVVAAATASGALLAEGGADVAALQSALPDESQCAAGSSDQDKDKDGLADAVIVDGRNLYEPETVEASGLQYYAIGRGRT